MEKDDEHVRKLKILNEFYITRSSISDDDLSEDIADGKLKRLREKYEKDYQNLLKKNRSRK